MKRVMIVTDSLGMPRDELKIEDTWVNKVMVYFSGKIELYPFSVRGLSIKYSMDTFNEIKYYDPDILIVQLGVVDASRRVLTRTELKIISLMPIFRDFIHKILRKYHFFLTKTRNIHYADLDKFEINLNSICSLTSKKDIKTIFVDIAPAGEIMKKKVFNIEKDIFEYSGVLKSVCDKHNNAYFLQPYKRDQEVVNEFDGHHLTSKGSEMVFKELCIILEKDLKGSL